MQEDEETRASSAGRESEEDTRNKFDIDTGNIYLNSDSRAGSIPKSWLGWEFADVT